MLDIFTTLLVSQSPMSWLNDVHCENACDIFVTRLTFHAPMPCKVPLKFTGLKLKTRTRKGVKMAPISETEKDSLGLFSTGAHALASQTPIYSWVLTFPFEAHKVTKRAGHVLDLRSIPQPCADFEGALVLKGPA